MSDSIRKAKSPSKTEQTESVTGDLSGSHASDLVDSIDDILDHIDEVLEENAEEFVKNYVQKGGE